MSDVDQALSVVENVVRRQNNIYIRELLRDREVEGIKVNMTEDELVALLRAAVQEQKITLEHLVEWIDETEGWGDAHIYLYKVSETVCRDACWEKKSGVAKLVRGVKDLAALWDVDTSVEYPNEWALTGIGYDQQARELTCLWHQGTKYWKRAPSMDIPEHVEGDGESYLYKAYRKAARRYVARIVFRPGSALAAIFLPGPMEPKTHGTRCESMANEISGVLALEPKRICSMADAIKALDARAMTKAKPLQSRNARFDTQDGGAHVEFASDTDEGYAQYDPVRKVRKAVAEKDFVGGAATFHFPLAPLAGSKAPREDAKVNLYGDFQRIRMWRHLKRDDVWNILATIRGALS